MRVFAVDANKLMKKPDMNKPAKPEKKLFGEEEAQPAAAAAASTSARCARPARARLGRAALLDHAGARAASPPVRDPPPHARTRARRSGGVSMEYQRQRAKEMTKYFQEQKTAQQIVESQ